MSKVLKDKACEEHPASPYLRMDRIPHIWCPTCGIGTVVKCYASALEENEMTSTRSPSFRESDARVALRVI